MPMTKCRSNLNNPMFLNQEKYTTLLVNNKNTNNQIGQRKPSLHHRKTEILKNFNQPNIWNVVGPSLKKGSSRRNRYTNQHREINSLNVNGIKRFTKLKLNNHVDADQVISNGFVELNHSSRNWNDKVVSTVFSP